MTAGVRPTPGALPARIRVGDWSFAWIDVELPLKSPLRTGRGLVATRTTRLLSVDGPWGAAWGEAAPPIGPTGPAWTLAHGSDWDAAASQALAAVGGELPATPDALMSALDPLGWPPETRALRAAIETALSGLAATVREIPLWHWLAEPGTASTDPWVPVNALLTEENPGALAREARDGIAAGYRTLKLKVTGPRLSSADLARVDAVAEAMRPFDGLGGQREVRLRLDANGAWSKDAALDALERLAPYGPEYVEQPVPPQPTEDFLEVARRAAVPVAADESAMGPDDLDGLLVGGGPPVIVVKPAFVGGPATASRMCRRVVGAGRTAIVTSGLDSAVGRYAALAVAASLAPPRPAAGLATAGLLAWDVHPGPVIESGRVRAPDEPGLGLAHDVVLAALRDR